MDPTYERGLREAVENEPFARKLGLELTDVDEGYARVEMVFDPETMGNIYGMTHGGAIFSLMDEAFQAASNSHGNIAVALNVSITYVAAPKPGERLQAEATLAAMTRKTATYDLKATGEEGRLLAKALATVYRLDKKPPFAEQT
ncbi:MAG: PaaI family thioesterase [Deltaproteobacteria bacterium]|nr:PaaI family thioesterase [Deltaproteobacteria bacterium]